MKLFTIFGDIYFEDNEALIYSVRHSGFYEDDDIEDEAAKWGGDWITPNYFQGKIIFTQYTKEQTK